MDIEMAKKYLPQGETHYIKEQFSDERLALFVSMFFITETDKSYENLTEEEKASYYWMKKEVAYQVVRRLIGNKEKVPTIIQTEEDWKRYFMLDE